MAVADRTLIFTYGTLKRGFPNHYLISSLALSGDAAFVAASRTVARLPLVVGPNGIPFLLNLPGSGDRVSGEIWSVSAAGLARIDELEGVGRGHYDRLPIGVESGDGDDRTVEAEAYHAHRSYGEEMWRRSGERGLPEYSAAEAAGYVPPEERPKHSIFLEEVRIFLGSHKGGIKP